MLHLIPRPLHRLAYRVAHAARKRVWRLLKPKIVGCRIIALDADGRVLLVRHTYGSRKWVLPGGGVARRENSLAASARELKEETGCDLAAPVELSSFEELRDGALHQVHLVAGQAVGTPRADLREILDAALFAADRLPEAMPAGLRAELSRWLTDARAARLAQAARDDQ